MDGPDDAISYTADAVGDNETRFAAVLSEHGSEPSWSFSDEVTLLPITDGRVSVLGSDGEVVAGIEAPWAIDAAGDVVPTRYRVEDGGRLVQEVDTTPATAYPVVADPTFKVLPGYIRVGFNREESFTAVGTTAGCTALLSKSPHPVGRALAVGCGAFAAYSGAQLAGGKCLSIKAVGAPPTMTWWPSFPKCG